jgi:hypothetical protein
VAVELSKIGAETTEIDEAINRPKQMILRDMILQRELVKQRRLRFLFRSHHRQSLPVEGIESGPYPSIKEEFFNKNIRNSDLR